MKSDDASKPKAIFSKARRYGNLPVNFPSLEELLEDNDETLFRSTIRLLSILHVNEYSM